MKVTLEGNRGAGKTTILNLLRKQGYSVNNQEPNTSHTFQADIKADIQRFAHTSETTELCLYERSPYSLARIYLPYYKSQGLIDQDPITELQSTHIWQPDVIIYLYCDPFVCHQRSKQSLTQLVELHNNHELVLDEMNYSGIIYKVNAQEDIQSVVGNVLAILGKLK